jgi:hypothetical protein
VVLEGGTTRRAQEQRVEHHADHWFAIAFNDGQTPRGRRNGGSTAVERIGERTEDVRREENELRGHGVSFDADWHGR